MSEQPSKETKLPSDAELLERAVRVLEYATYHDGRYGQLTDERFQDEAIAVSKLICQRLGRKRYADIKTMEARTNG